MEHDDDTWSLNKVIIFTLVTVAFGLLILGIVVAFVAIVIWPVIQ